MCLVWMWCFLYECSMINSKVMSFPYPFYLDFKKILEKCRCTYFQQYVEVLFLWCNRIHIEETHCPRIIAFFNFLLSHLFFDYVCATIARPRKVGQTIKISIVLFTKCPLCNKSSFLIWACTWNTSLYEDEIFYRLRPSVFFSFSRSPKQQETARNVRVTNSIVLAKREVN